MKIQPQVPMSNKIIITQRSRWPIQQVGENTIEVHIPQGDGPASISEEFAKAHHLSESEYATADRLVIESLIWIK
jgi:hypothetical protein